MTKPTEFATVADSIQLHGDLGPDDLDNVLDHWGKLDARLRSYRRGTVQLHLSVKERDTQQQRTTLEAVVAGYQPFVATSQKTDLDQALNEVRDEMIRQLADAKTKAAPRNGSQTRRAAG